MSMRFALHDMLARGRRGLAACGAALERAGGRLERLEAAMAAEPDVPAGLRKLCGAVEWPVRDPEQDVTAPAALPGAGRRGAAVRAHEDGAAGRQGSGATRPDSAAAAPGGRKTGGPARSEPEAGGAPGQAAGMTGPEPRAGALALPGTMAAAGAGRAVLPARVAAPGHTPSRAPLPDPRGSGAEARLAAVLDRIDFATQAAGSGAGAAPVSPHGIGAADPRMPGLRLAPARGAEPGLGTTPPFPETAAAGGLGRLMARGRAAGLVPATAPSRPAVPGLAACVEASALPAASAAAAADPVAVRAPLLPHPMPMGAAARPEPALPDPVTGRPGMSYGLTPVAEAAPLPPERLARDLAALLRREARLAGIDLDGGAP